MKNALLITLLSYGLISCGGSEVGRQQDEPPVAVASVFGASVTTTGVVTVRSGSEVLLSGENSDGVDDPLIGFRWQQVGATDYEPALYERATSSVGFTAPMLPATETSGVDLQFQLTVVDGDGESASDLVTVKVLPVNDLNHFLLKPQVDERLVWLVAPEGGVTLDADVPVSVLLTYRVDWLDRSGESQSVEYHRETLSGVALAASARAITDARNTYFAQPIPLLDIDNVNTFFQGDGRLELEGVEAATLTVLAELEQSAVGSLRLYLAKDSVNGFEVIDTTAVETAANTFEFSVEWARQIFGLESKRSANNYYACIDPADEAASLSSWLAQAGFTDDADDVVHTTYVNNFDLNFGRDMYVRTDDIGNVYSYVTNYPTLENALTNRNDFAVVVMEYSAAPTGQCGDGTFEDDASGKKIVKFYAYVPDELTGEYVRAPTMNFDGRGERALPGVCIACHFGSSNTEEFNVADLASISATAANLNSSFMPWDLDAFLYTADATMQQSDPLYAANQISDDVTAAFSREAQEAAFRRQNQAVLDTFTHDQENLLRFETPIKLLHGWYGNPEIETLDFGSEDAPLSSEQLQALKTKVDTLPNNRFDGEGYVPQGWTGQESLYADVFARNCRLCHVQIGDKEIDFDNYREFVTNERLGSYVFEQGVMPLSRLTMDRFWTDYYGRPSAALVLREHLNNDAFPANDVHPSIVPGLPVAVVSPSRDSEQAYDVALDFDEVVLLDGSLSLFADQYTWQLSDVQVSTASKYEFVASTPGASDEVSFMATDAETQLTTGRVSRVIETLNYTPDVSAAPAQSVTERATVEINLFDGLCPTGSVDAKVCRDIFGDIVTGEIPELAIVADSENLGDATISAPGVVTFRSTNLKADGELASFQFTVTDSFGETSLPGTVNINVNAIDGPTANADSCLAVARSFDRSGFQPITGVECPYPADNDIPLAGFDSLVVSAVDRSATAGEISFNSVSGAIDYRPERFFTGTDRFDYSVHHVGSPDNVSIGAVTITVRPTLSFDDDIVPSINTYCSACHIDASPATSTTPSWAVYSNLVAALTNTVLSDGSGYGAPELSLVQTTTTEDLLTSVFFQKACDEIVHTGGNILCDTTPLNDVSDLNNVGRTVLKWLEEGRLNN